MDIDANAANASIADPSPSALATPPGPPPMGRLRMAYRQLRIMLDPLGTVAKRFGEYGDAYRVHQPDGDLYAFKHPDHIRDVLVTQAASFDKQHPAFRMLSEVLGDALVTSDGERWRRQRRLVQPAFARPRLAQYAAVMVDEACGAVARLQNARDLDLSRELNALTLRVVTRTLFGQSSYDTSSTGAAMLEVNRWFGTPPQLMRWRLGARARFDAATENLNRTIDKLIAVRREQLAREPEPSDLLSALLSTRDEDGASLSPGELRDQLLTLYVAGHETTSHALTWAFYLLSQHAEVVNELREEYARVLGKRAPQFEDVPALKYTECVVKEALRLYPPVFVVPRYARDDATVGRYFVPKGSEVILWIYHTQRDPRFFPEPERFRPERFSGAEDSERPKYAWVPFGAGQRACIGQSFAMLEAQLVLATLIHRLDFRYTGKRPPQPATGVTLSPRGGMPVRVTRRK